MAWDNTSFNLELNRKEVEIVVVRMPRPGSRKKYLLTARGWKPKPNQETRGHLLLVCSSRYVLWSSLRFGPFRLRICFTFPRRSLGSGGLSVWAYAPITSDIMPFEAGDPGAPSKFWMGTLWKNLMSKEGSAKKSIQSQISTF